MTCEQVCAQLNALLDDELAPGAANILRQHLTDCAHCAAECAALRRLCEEARTWRDVSPPAALRARIAAALLSAVFDPTCDEVAPPDAIQSALPQEHTHNNTKGNQSS